MKTTWSTAALAAAVAIPLLAGGMYLEVSNPAHNAEATAKHAIAVAQIAACHAPEKTTVKAFAEGMKDGARTSVPLHVTALKAPGAFAVLPDNLGKGAWVLKVTATNPEYTNYVAGLLAPIAGSTVEWKSARQFRHDPTETDISAAMRTGQAEAVAAKTE